MSEIKLPEADADGWMPWSGGENPVRGYSGRVEVCLRSGDEFTGSDLKDDNVWSHVWGEGDIIAFRLAPPAPVEASGSERTYSDAEVIADTVPADLRQKALQEIEVLTRDRLIPTLTTVHEIAVAALRPQPSGETREKVTRIVELAIVRHGVPETDLEGTLDDADAILALLSARPLALGGQHSTATDFPPDDVLACVEGRQEVLAVDPEDMRIIGDWINDGELSSSVPAGRIKALWQDVRKALSTTPARAEALDEGAAGDLKPCPFCGGEAEIIHLDDDDNAGGSCVCCTKCQASGNVEFGRKENFVENWNRRAHPSPTPAADADRVRIAVEALEPFANWLSASGREEDDGCDGDAMSGDIDGPVLTFGHLRRAAEALAALKSTAAKEGGE